MVQLTMRRRGFTIIELLVSVAIITVLARLISLSLTTQRVVARDATRRAALGQYSTALEQYYAQRHSYLVTPTGCSVATSSETYPGNTGAFLPEGSLATCVGYKGGGWGSINRHAMANYGPKSISEELRAEGYIQTISFDPRTGGTFPMQTADQVIATKGVEEFDDFILTLCDANGSPAKDAASATEYGIYAEFETPAGATSTAPEGTHANTSCGGPNTISGGWNTLQ